MHRALVLMCLALSATSAFGRDDILIADFETDDYGEWRAEGEAFGPGPAKGTLPGQMGVSGYEGERLVNSFFKGDGSTGVLTSPVFKIERPHLNFLIGGGGYAGETCVNLLVGDKVVRTATGPNTESGGSEALDWVSWDVADLQGQQARIQIVDRRTGGWGHINVDHILQSDRKVEAVPATRELLVEKRYLHLPVKTGAPKRRVKVLLDGESVREMDIELAAGEAPSFTAALDVQRWQGRTLTLDAGSFVGGESALEDISQSDEFPAADELYREPLRPRFHFTSRIGWLNDPNGLVWHDGEWHLFYQHNPFGWEWGNMHWGHAVSPDLVHWKELPDAIHPWSDCVGAAFSGSAVIDHRNTSGFGSKQQPPLVAALTDTGAGESLAWSLDNGRSFKMYPGNPVVKHQGRDPKIIWHEPTQRWVMAVYSEPEGEQVIDFHSSENLKAWRFESRIDGWFECPDIFELPVDGDKTNTRWVVYAADGQYAVGKFDGRTFTAEHEGKRQVWFGNFYAAQTYDNAPDGRRVQIGWGRYITFPGMRFNQQMTVPVELTLHSAEDGVRMHAQPVEELQQLRAESSLKLNDVELGPEPREVELDADAFEVAAELEVSDKSRALLRVRGVEIVFAGNSNTLTCGDKQAQLEPRNGRVSLRILVDRGSIELFANDGRVAISHGQILDQTKPAIEVFGDNARAASIEAWALKSAWPAP